MDIKISRDQRNELLVRREATFSVEFEGATPSRQQILAKIAALLNVPASHVVLDSLQNKFGTSSLTGNVRIYDNEEQKKKTERPYFDARGQPKVKEEGA